MVGVSVYTNTLYRTGWVSFINTCMCINAAHVAMWPRLSLVKQYRYRSLDLEGALPMRLFML